MPHPIVPNLWFDTQAEEAAAFYTSIFPNSRVGAVARYTEAGPGPAGSVMTVEFELNGQRFVGINGGPQFPFTEAVSFQITCDSQDEIDDYWARLTDGGEEGPCGWCKDRFGLSWQIVPKRLYELLEDSDQARSRAAIEAMMRMRKIVVAELEAAADSAMA